MENKYEVKFKKAFVFEGKEHNKVDLTGIEELLAQDLINASSIYMSQTGMPSISEADMLYTLIIASTATDKPLNFYQSLPAKEAMKVKRIVSDFLFTEA